MKGTLSVIIILTVLSIHATTQDFFSEQDKLRTSGKIFESVESEKMISPAFKKTRSKQDWWEPDTIIHINAKADRTSRFFMKYNSSGLLIERILEISDYVSTRLFQCETYTYDSNDNILTYRIQRRGDDLWVHYSHIEYTYNSDNKILTISEINGNGDIITQFSYTYDSNNNLITKIYHQWRKALWETSYFDTLQFSYWDTLQLNVYTYDANNNLLTELCEKDGYSQLDTYTYDTNNNVINFVSQYSWNYPWVNGSSYTCTYDSNNNLLTKLNQTWMSNSWENSSLITCTYDPNNNLLTKLDQNWQNNLWINKKLNTYSYNLNNSVLTELIQQVWSENLWKDYDLYIYTYDSNENLTTKTMQFLKDSVLANFYKLVWVYDENGNGKSVEHFRWSWLDTWIEADGSGTTQCFSLPYNNMQSGFGDCFFHKMTASYIKVSDIIANIEPVTPQEQSNISIFPNPTTGELGIRNYELGIRNYELGIRNVEVYDIIGKKLSTVNYQLSTINSIDISHLPAGIYFVKITTEKGVVTKKVVKK